MGTYWNSQGEAWSVVLVGKAGSGKSSLGNTLLGKDVFPVGSDFGRVPSNAKEDWQSDQFGNQVVDTPGFSDTELNETDIACSLVRAVHTLVPGPDALLFVVKVGRFTSEDARAYRILKALFDSEVSKYTIVVFTGGDYLEKENMSIERCISDGPEELKDILEECDQRYVVFNNKAPTRRPQVEELLSKIRTLKERHKGMPFVSPYPHNSPSSPDDSRTKELIHRRLNSLKEWELKEERQLHLDKRQITEERERCGEKKLATKEGTLTEKRSSVVYFIAQTAVLMLLDSLLNLNLFRPSRSYYVKGYGKYSKASSASGKQDT